MRSHQLRSMLALACLCAVLVFLDAPFAQAQQAQPPQGPSPLVLFDDIKLMLIGRSLKITPEQATKLAAASQQLAAIQEQKRALKSAAYKQLEPVLAASLQAAVSGTNPPPGVQGQLNSALGKLNEALQALDVKFQTEYAKALEILTPEQRKLIMTPEEEAQALAEAEREDAALDQVMKGFQQLQSIPTDQYEANKDAWATGYLEYIFGAGDPRVKSRHKAMVQAMDRARKRRPEQLARFLQMAKGYLALQLGLDTGQWDPYSSKKMPRAVVEDFLSHPRTATLLNLYAARAGDRK